MDWNGQAFVQNCMIQDIARVLNSLSCVPIPPSPFTLPLAFSLSLCIFGETNHFFNIKKEKVTIILHNSIFGYNIIKWNMKWKEGWWLTSPEKYIHFICLKRMRVSCPGARPQCHHYHQQQQQHHYHHHQEQHHYHQHHYHHYHLIWNCYCLSINY